MAPSPASSCTRRGARLQAPPSTSLRRCSSRRLDRGRPQGSLSTLVLSVTRDKVRAGDLLIGNRNDPDSGGDRDLLLRGAYQLAGQALVPVAGLTQAHFRALPEEATEVLRLGQRTVLSRRGHLDRVLLA